MKLRFGKFTLCMSTVKLSCYFNMALNRSDDQPKCTAPGQTFICLFDSQLIAIGVQRRAQRFPAEPFVFSNTQKRILVDWAPF
jgi:hypothetical protein